MIGERRLATLRSLSTELNKATTEEEVVSCVIRCLGENRKDLPFTLTYLFDEGGKQARLACRTGIRPGHPAAPDLIECKTDSVWPFAELQAGKDSLVVEDLRTRFDGLPSGFWDRPPWRALLLPITSLAQGTPAGVLITGLNPYRPLDVSYAGFLNLVSGQLESLDKKMQARTDQLESRTLEMLQQSEGVRALSAQLLELQNEERRHIARELHDGAGQTLAVLNMNLARLVEEARTNAPQIAAGAQAAEQLGQQLQREIRTASYLLHPPLLDECGLASALEWYVRGVVERTGLAIDLQVSEDFGRVSKEVELLVFRVVQECLTNIHRHSHSESASIHLRRDDQSLTLEVQDRGKGIPPEKLSQIQSGGSGLGIRGMRERIRHFSGNMTIDSNESGTRVRVTIPVSTAEPEKKITASP